MLAGVPDQQYTVTRLKLGEEVAHLFGAGQAGFINHIQMPLGSRLADTREEPLQGVGKNSGISELVRGARGRGKTFDDIAPLFGRLGMGGLGGYDAMW